MAHSLKIFIPSNQIIYYIYIWYDILTTKQILGKDNKYLTNNALYILILISVISILLNSNNNSILKVSERIIYRYTIMILNIIIIIFSVNEINRISNSDLDIISIFLLLSHFNLLNNIS